MLIAFPFTGYTLFSIISSTLFLMVSYVFTYLVFKPSSSLKKQTNSYVCSSVSLCYMIISSSKPWSLGVIMKTFGETYSWYRNAFYFYLHFRYDG